MSAVAQYFELKPADRRLLNRTFFLVLFVRLWLWLASYHSLSRFLHWLARQTRNSSRISMQYPDRASWAVQSVSRCIPGARTCLVEAMALQFILQRHGIPSHMQVGVCKDEQGKLRAHAWIECRGHVVIGGTDLSAYTLLGKPKSQVL